MITWITHNWSYVLAPFGLAGLWMAGRRNRWGWALGIFAQVLWLTYGVQTRQWGFIPGSAAYLFIYAKNFIAWSSKAKEKAVSEETNDLYRSLRYLLETTLAPTDADSAVTDLDELVKQVQRDDATKLLNRREERDVELGPDFPDGYSVESDTWDAAADLINPDHT